MKKDIQKLLDEKKIDQVTFDKMMKDFNKVISERDNFKKELKDSQVVEPQVQKENNQDPNILEALKKINEKYDKKIDDLENKLTVSKNSEILKNAGMKESMIQKFVNDKDVMENVENHKKENSFLYDSKKPDPFISKEGGSTVISNPVDGLTTEENQNLNDSFNPNNL